MLIRNPVAKNMHKSVRASVVPQKQRLLKSEATLRDARELLSESLFNSETMCFDGYSIDYIVLDELSEIICEENACLGDIGSSSILIDDREED
jgi:hypothetical protein